MVKGLQASKGVHNTGNLTARGGDLIKTLKI